MRPSEAEFQALVACKRLASRPGAEATRDGIEACLREIFGDKALEAAPALDSLIERGWISLPEAGGRLVMSGDAKALADFASDDGMSGESFGSWMTKCERSPAYLRYCELVYGLPMAQFNMVDLAQMEGFLSLSGLAPGMRLLDLGCGIGSQAEYLSDRVGARVTGLDYAPASIERALERTKAKRDRLSFIVADLDHLDAFGQSAFGQSAFGQSAFGHPDRGLKPSFDVAVFFDSLYFARDLEKTLVDTLALLVPGGKLLAFWSEYAKADAAPEDIESAGNPLGKALARLGLAFTSLDYSANDLAFWESSLRLALEHKAAFEAEDGLDLFWGRVIEAEEILEAIARGKARRYLYSVEKA